MSRLAVVVALAALALGAAACTGCSKKASEVAEPPPGQGAQLPRIRGAEGGSADPGAKGTDTAPGGAAGADASYKLAVSAPPSAAGAKAVAHVSVTPSTGWHVNKDYPIRLTLNAPGDLQIEKPVLEAADVTKLDDNELTFDVKLTPAKAGTYKVDGELKFAVCTPETCDPKKQPIAFELVAQ